VGRTVEGGKEAAGWAGPCGEEKEKKEKWPGWAAKGEEEEGREREREREWASWAGPKRRRGREIK
jgi:hypothetical protein